MVILPQFAFCFYLIVFIRNHLAQIMQRLLGKAGITSGLRLERFEFLRRLIHSLREQSQEHQTIDRLEKGCEQRQASILCLE